MGSIPLAFKLKLTLSSISSNHVTVSVQSWQTNKNMSVRPDILQCSGMSELLGQFGLSGQFGQSVYPSSSDMSILRLLTSLALNCCLFNNLSWYILACRSNKHATVKFSSQKLQMNNFLGCCRFWCSHTYMYCAKFALRTLLSFFCCFTALTLHFS